MSENSTELSERELEVLKLVATGASNKEIAQKLSISLNTVKVHLRNIFNKIQVTSRTEATLYAIQHGLAQVPAAPAGEAAALPEEPAVEPDRPDRPRRTWLLAVVALASVLMIGGVGVAMIGRPTPAPAAALVPTPQRWERRAPLPEARGSLAAATYENRIYAIGGVTAAGVTGAVEVYDPTLDAWVRLADKPVPVAEVEAAVVGGSIYVPGGRTASGAVTDALEVYDPRADLWEQRAPLPRALSAYGLAAFEGRLYLFGGWDGGQFVASVYEYDPAQDAWAELTSMPTARGHVGVAVAGGKIYVIGGEGQGGALTVSEEFSPERQGTEEAPWRQRAPLPEARSGMSVASVADIIYIFGGSEEAAGPMLKYLSQLDIWESQELMPIPAQTNMGVGQVQDRLYVIGGANDSGFLDETWSYQTLYTVVIPVIP